MVVIVLVLALPIDSDATLWRVGSHEVGPNQLPAWLACATGLVLGVRHMSAVHEATEGGAVYVLVGLALLPIWAVGAIFRIRVRVAAFRVRTVEHRDRNDRQACVRPVRRLGRLFNRDGTTSRLLVEHQGMLRIGTGHTLIAAQFDEHLTLCLREHTGTPAGSERYG